MVPDDAVRRVFKLLRGGARLTPDPNVLTAREREVLAHFARGKSYARVAEVLGVSITTVRNTVYRIQHKLGVASKQEIVVWAAQNGLVHWEQDQQTADPQSYGADPVSLTPGAYAA